MEAVPKILPHFTVHIYFRCLGAAENSVHSLLWPPHVEEVSNTPDILLCVDLSFA